MNKNNIDVYPIHPGIKTVLLGSANYSLYHRGNGVFRLRQKPGVSKETVQNDPRFARTREAGQLFGAASKNAKLIRMAFGEQGKTVDGTMVTRLQQVMMRCMKGDKTKLPYEPLAVKGDLSIFSRFHFNKTRNSHNDCSLHMACLIDRDAGAVTLAIPSFSSRSAFQKRGSATHFKMTLVAAEIDFEQQTFRRELSSTDYHPIDKERTGLIELNADITLDSNSPVFAMLRIEFFNGRGGMDRVAAGNYDMITIVKAEGVMC
jgi:hypothetical protein